MRSRLLTMIAAALALAATAGAQDSYRHGRIRHVEGGTLLQRATEPGTEEALPNFPFLPGDRIWTTDTGRAEFQFPARRLVRLDVRSKLDYVVHEEGEGSEERNVLRLWSGAAFVHLLDEGEPAGLEIETPGGLVVVRERAVLRIDVASGETGVSVYAGAAVLDSGRERLTLEAGERSFARFGDVERAEPFDTRQADAFARWNGEREASETYVAEGAPELPEEVAPYAAELEPYGSWHVEVGIGDVWVPQVGAGWAPYLNGRWAWTPYGWTWVPYDPWGWAPFHYGSWGFSAGLGWYWAPGAHWGPAWVSWSVGGGHVGWCPIGPRGRPVVLPEHRGRDYAVPRGGAGPRSAWVYAREGDLAAHDVARRRVSLADRETRALRVIESPERGHVDRSLRVVEGRAVPRHVSTRPTPGDTIEELRTDPATSIPFPTARRRYPSELERRQDEGTTRSRQRFSSDAESATPSEPRSVRRRDAARPSADPAEVSTGQVSRRPPSGWSTPETSASAGSRARSTPATRSRDDGEAARSREDARADSPERRILRRMFGSLNERRSGASSNDRRRDSGSARTPSASSNDRRRDSGSARTPSASSSQPERRSGGSSVRSQPQRRQAPPRVQQPRQPSPPADQSAKQRKKKDS